MNEVGSNTVIENLPTTWLEHSEKHHYCYAPFNAYFITGSGVA